MHRSFPIFEGLGSEPRFKLTLILVKRGTPLSVSEIAQIYECSVSVASRHLDTLYRSGVVERETQGRKKLYGIAPKIRELVYNAERIVRDRN